MTTFNELYFRSDDGLTLYARDYASQGDKAKCPIICVHGLTRNSSDFEEIAPWLAQQGRRVLAVDVRGRGHSDHDSNPDNYNPIRYAKDIANLMHQLGIARAVFIGTSMGGITTMTLALQNLKLIVAAVLNDVGPRLSSTGLQRIAGYAGKSKNPDSMAQAAAYIKEINHYAFPDNTDEEWEKWARRAFEVRADGKVVSRYDPNIALPLPNGRLTARSFWAKLVFKRLTKNRPCLLIRGAISDLIEDEQLREMQKLAPRMKYAEVAGVGHAPMLTEPSARQALHDFLEQCD
ncbi:MAG: alpha/beta hydrolase [Burkholderiaceae bacterium]|nr:MAG: alpha/beta hydrolase [Burkholderiaceae bacterium]